MDGPLVFILTFLAWFVPLSIIASGYIRIIYSVKSNLFSPRQDNVISAEVDRARRVRELSFFMYRIEIFPSLEPGHLPKWGGGCI